MRALGFGLVLLGTAVGFAAGCGSSTDDGPSNGGGAGTAAGGSSTSSAGTSSGKAGDDAKAGASSAGSSSGGSSPGGSAAGGVAVGGLGSGGQPDTQAGAGNDAGSPSALVDCDPSKIMCKRAAPACDAGQVPSVDDAGSCYGDCVKIDRCACSTAQQCPDQNQYTCWAKQHCGPFVQ
jgi:hypothetical protein